MADLAEDRYAARLTGAADPALPRSALQVLDGGLAETRHPPRPKVLLLASLYRLPYRVMRCAAAAGVEIYVLGDLGARGLGLSRHCRRFFATNRIVSGNRDEGLAIEINCLARDLGIAMVMPGDAPSTRALIACRDLLALPSFPLPDLDRFDRLNDKWAFTRLCDELGSLPPSRLVPTIAALEEAIAAGEIEFPVVAKPLDMSGNQGCIVLDESTVAPGLKAINYQPIIVQRFIPGEDIGASVFARAGEVVAFVAHRFVGNTYETFRDNAVLTELSRLVRHLDLDGVYNFDMRRTAAGEIHYLECNPRFFYKINLSMVTGINFVELGLPVGEIRSHTLIPDGTTVHLPKGMFRSPRRWLRWTGKDLAMAVHLYSDPLPHLLEGLGILS